MTTCPKCGEEVQECPACEGSGKDADGGVCQTCQGGGLLNPDGSAHFGSCRG